MYLCVKISVYPVSIFISKKEVYQEEHVYVNNIFVQFEIIKWSLN